MTELRDAIAAIYDQVAAPDWAARNLDALADVLRDLSWLPAGPVAVRVPDTGAGADRLAAVLRDVERETAGSVRPVHFTPSP